MYIAEADIEGVLSGINELAPRADESILIAVGEKSWTNTDRIVERLNEAGISFFGGIFPGVITGGRKYERGAVLTKVPVTAPPKVIRGISSGTYDLSRLQDEQCRLAKSVLVFVDGLAQHIDRFIKDVSDGCSDEVTFSGGGAGSISLRKQPCVITNEGILSDAAVVCPVAARACSGVQHGWVRLRGPFVANKVNGNVLCEFNYRNALELYREIVEADSGKRLKAEHFYDLAMRYPFGIHTEGMEDIVRDPLLLDNHGGLVCCGDILENGVLSILRGDYENLIRAAGKAADDCLEEAGDERVSHAFVIDCISRFYFLGDYFERELDVINSKLAMAPGSPEPLGVLSLGEVASYGTGSVRLFNKTTVLTVLKEG
jgi:hypothetical protein